MNKEGLKIGDRVVVVHSDLDQYKAGNVGVIVSWLGYDDYFSIVKFEYGQEAVCYTHGDAWYHGKVGPHEARGCWPVQTDNLRLADVEVHAEPEHIMDITRQMCG
jgi:hypothetical protein